MSVKNKYKQFDSGDVALKKSTLSVPILNLIDELFNGDFDLDKKYIETPAIRLLQEISDHEQMAAIKEFVERFKKAKHKIRKSRPGYFRGVCQKYWKQNRERQKLILLDKARKGINIGRDKSLMDPLSHSPLIREAIDLLFTPASGLQTSIIDDSIARRLHQLSDEQGIQALYEFCSAVMYRQERIRNMNAYLMNIISRQMQRAKCTQQNKRQQSHKHHRNMNNMNNVHLTDYQSNAYANQLHVNQYGMPFHMNSPLLYPSSYNVYQHQMYTAHNTPYAVSMVPMAMPVPIPLQMQMQSNYNLHPSYYHHSHHYPSSSSYPRMDVQSETHPTSTAFTTSKKETEYVEECASAAADIANDSELIDLLAKCHSSEEDSKEVEEDKQSIKPPIITLCSTSSPNKNEMLLADVGEEKMREENTVNSLRNELHLSMETRSEDCKLIRKKSSIHSHLVSIKESESNEKYKKRQKQSNPEKAVIEYLKKRMSAGSISMKVKVKVKVRVKREEEEFKAEELQMCDSIAEQAIMDSKPLTVQSCCSRSNFNPFYLPFYIHNRVALAPTMKRAAVNSINEIDSCDDIKLDSVPNCSVGHAHAELVNKLRKSMMHSVSKSLQNTRNDVSYDKPFEHMIDERMNRSILQNSKSLPPLIIPLCMHNENERETDGEMYAHYHPYYTNEYTSSCVFSPSYQRSSPLKMKHMQQRYEQPYFDDCVSEETETDDTVIDKPNIEKVITAASNPQPLPKQRKLKSRQSSPKPKAKEATAENDWQTSIGVESEWVCEDYEKEMEDIDQNSMIDIDDDDDDADADGNKDADGDGDGDEDADVDTKLSLTLTRKSEVHEQHIQNTGVLHLQSAVRTSAVLNHPYISSGYSSVSVPNTPSNETSQLNQLTSTAAQITIQAQQFLQKLPLTRQQLQSVGSNGNHSRMSSAGNSVCNSVNNNGTHFYLDSFNTSNTHAMMNPATIPTSNYRYPNINDIQYNPHMQQNTNLSALAAFQMVQNANQNQMIFNAYPNNIQMQMYRAQQQQALNIQRLQKQQQIRKQFSKY